jgi:hypothetical protein
MSDPMYPTPDWMIEGYSLWAEIWQDCLWTLDELKTFDKCPPDIEERLI